MKKFYTLICLIAFPFVMMCAQTQVREQIPVFTQDPKANFRLFPTTNIYNFIELDTRTGKMNMVQWSTKAGSSFKYPLHNQSMVYSKADEIPGRFTLYATTNIHTFILLDQVDGRAWQVQWDVNESNSMVVQIF